VTGRPEPASGHHELFTGWGRTAPTRATRLRPATDADLVAAVRVARSGGRGLIARGLGRSYGDAAQNAGGLVVDMTGRDRVLDWAPDTGTVSVEAGISVDRLLRLFVPKGWFVPVVPGTRYVTVGGAIGADIHGKNHHVSGAFCQHVTGFDLLGADGEVRTVTPAGDPALFWATAGGMGLTGVVLRATIRLTPVRTHLMKVDTERVADLDEMLDRLAGTDDRYTYSVSWIDLLARGRHTGRGVLTRGWHATPADLPAGRTVRPYDPKIAVHAPDLFPPGLLNRLTVGAFNELWFRKAPLERRGEVQRIESFFHPLDLVGGWNRIYGRHGLVQYQFVVPFSEVAALRRCVELVASSGHASFLAVLKRFGPADAGPLSFPTPGWTLALDLPAAPTLAPLLDRLDDAVLAAGGRVYLAKDSRLRPDALARMYPRLGEFREVREKVDPDRIFVSDLARRLNL
jgi:decaprenylphospho-beta-D-ribofuranose 2-oxidase